MSSPLPSSATENCRRNREKRRRECRLPNASVGQWQQKLADKTAAQTKPELPLATEAAGKANPNV